MKRIPIVFLAAVCVLFIEHSVMLISSVWIMCFKPRRHGWLVSDLISFLILLSISVKKLFSYSQWWCDLRIEVRDAYDIQDRMHFFEYVQILEFAYHMFETKTMLPLYNASYQLITDCTLPMVKIEWI